MLKTVKMSMAKKTSGCAVTYRSGSKSIFSTCPTDCPLNPQPKLSVQTVDRHYFQAMLAAVPRGGHSFVYTHFNPVLWIQDYRDRLVTRKPTTVVNYSADNLGEAKSAMNAGLPTVIALPKGSERRVWRVDGLRLVRCPAEYQNVTCATCGGAKGPLCARPQRNYVVAFYAHGPGAKHVGTPTQAGCYAAGGNVRLHWDATRAQGSVDDAEHLRAFARQLPRGSVLRHHVAGDIGAED